MRTRKELPLVFGLFESERDSETKGKAAKGKRRRNESKSKRADQIPRERQEKG
jgi:hypothetical protein